MERVNILWFRNGLRLHDNGSLHNAIKDTEAKLLPLFIFDGETPVTKVCGFNKMEFMLECLQDIDEQLGEVGGRLYCATGSPEQVFRRLSKKVKLERICFDQDSEPIWLERDNAVKNFCVGHKVEVRENIGATLWNPLEIIEANGGLPPLTYRQFCHVTHGLGPPKRPVESVDLKSLNLVELDEAVLGELQFFPTVPTPETLGYVRDIEAKVYKGGERRALNFFHQRIRNEKLAFIDGSFLPNQRDPDILNPPKSLSPDLKFGCISVRTFYWAVMDTFEEVNEGNPPPGEFIVSQLIWREFFYAMAANNPFFGEMKRNPICINIKWSQNDEHLETFLAGRTGFPFIDAGIRQLRKEGWIHHILRNAISMFLTRGDLYLSWEHGENFFLTTLIDGDWAVNAGNWLWVSSSAFENALISNSSLDPMVYGRRVDPKGEYIKKFIPELSKYPVEYIYAPWTAPLQVQETAGCIIGKDYPAPMVDHEKVMLDNHQKFMSLQAKLTKGKKKQPKHIKPSDTSEVLNFFRIAGEEVV